MFDKIASVEQRYEALGELLAQPEVTSNLALLQQYAREQRELEAVVMAYRSYKQTSVAVEEAHTLFNESADDAEMRELAQEELSTKRAQLEQLEAQMTTGKTEALPAGQPNRPAPPPTAKRPAPCMGTRKKWF